MNQSLANAQAMRFLNELGLTGYELNYDYVVIPAGMGYVFSFGGKKYSIDDEHFYRPNTEKGATYEGGVGVISPANGKFDIYTCDLAIIERAQKAMGCENTTVPVRFYKGGRDVSFNDPMLNDKFDAMFKIHHNRMANVKNNEAYDQARKYEEAAQKMLEELGLKGFEEGKNYIVLSDGEKYQFWDSWEKKLGKHGQIDLKHLGYSKDGKSCSSYNGGAMTIYDGKSDFIILTTDPQMMDRVKTDKTGGWVPCYNAGKEAVFQNQYVDYNFRRMIEFTDEKKGYVPNSNDGYGR